MNVQNITNEALIAALEAAQNTKPEKYDDLIKNAKLVRNLKDELDFRADTGLVIK